MGQDTDRMGREDEAIGDWEGWDIAITSPHDSVSSIGGHRCSKEATGTVLTRCSRSGST
jgi:hypothetical protein